jgi:hypothetical protein
MKSFDAHAVTPDNAPEESRQTISSALQVLMKTQAMRETLSILIPEVVHLWAGDNRLKNKIARPIGKSIQKGLRTDNRDNSHPTHVRCVMPDIITSLMAALESAAQAFEAFSPEEKEEQVKALFAQCGTGQAGRILTRAMRALHDLHGQNPTVLADAMTPVVQRWIEKTDFGALRDVADTIEPEIRALAIGINDTLWRYPSKLVLSLSFLPDLVNLAVICLGETIGRFNRAAPDLVADILLSMVRSVDGKSLGIVLNELTELARKVHTGSALIGEVGAPRLQEDLRQMVAAILEHLDSRAFWRARVVFAEDKEVFRRSLVDVLADHPEVITGRIKTYAARKNPDWRARRHGLEALEAVPDDDMAAALEEGLSDLDLQELGEVVNLTGALANRLMALKPELLGRLAEQVAGSLDMGEIETVVHDILHVAGPSLRPVGRAILPEILSEICRTLEPAEDDYEPRMAEVRQQLRSLLMGEAVTS